MRIKKIEKRFRCAQFRASGGILKSIGSPTLDGLRILPRQHLILRGGSLDGTTQTTERVSETVAGTVL